MSSQSPRCGCRVIKTMWGDAECNTARDSWAAVAERHFYAIAKRCGSREDIKTAASVSSRPTQEIMSAGSIAGLDLEVRTSLLIVFISARSHSGASKSPHILNFIYNDQNPSLYHAKGAASSEEKHLIDDVESRILTPPLYRPSTVSRRRCE